MGTQQLPGTEDKVIAEIADAAEAYRKAMQARLPLTKQEAEAKEALIEVMKKHKRDVYTDQESGVTYRLTKGKESIRLQEPKGASE